MENRFAVKDFVFVMLLLTIIVVLVVEMVQKDRQWESIQNNHKTLTEQTKDLTAIRKDLRKLTQGGVVVANPKNGGTNGNGSDNGHANSNASVDNPDEAGKQDVFYRLNKTIEENDDYARGDWFIDNFSAVPPKLNELTAQDTYSRVIYCRVLESLGETHIGTAKVVPLLAESWQHGEDGLSTVIKLRKTVTFSTGEAFTADDVVYTHSLIMNPKISDGRTRAYYRTIEKVEKIDDFTVRFVYNVVHYENFLRAASIKMHSKAFLSQFTDEEIAEHPAMLVGTGPYKLPDALKYTPGDPIVMLRNERYWGTPGPWDRMIYNVIQNESTEQIAFQNGELDIFVPTPEQHVKMLEKEDLLAKKNYRVYEHVRTGYTYIAWNQKRKTNESKAAEPTLFADKRVRQALAMMIDRQRMIDDIFLGYANIATGPFHHMGKQYNNEVKAWPYDPKKAIALLKEVGFTVDAQGRILQPDGKQFAIELSYPSGSEFFESIVSSLKANFERAGIHLKQNALRWSVLMDKLDKQDFDAISLGWGAGGTEGDIEQMFHTRNIKEGDNRNSYSNPKLDKLIEKAHVTLDEGERMKIWKTCHGILREDQPYLFLFRPKVRLWSDKRIKNIKPIDVFGVNYVSTWSVPLEWYVPKEQQKH